MSALVTGDAVVLGLQPAKLPSRALAVAIDLVVVVAAYVLISVVLALATASLDDAAIMALSIATSLLVLVGAPIAVETLSRGRSLGKLACGLRVVRDDGGPIRFRHALVRGAMGVVEILMTFGVVACIASLVSARGRRIGDVFAGTLVVRERVPTAREAVPPPPPWLVGRFAELDLSGVPDDLWLAIRQYLTRMTQLDPGVSALMAGRLADELAGRTGAPAPAGVPPAAFLAAVVSERQARDARRAFGTHPGAGAGQGGVQAAPGSVAGVYSSAGGRPGGYGSAVGGAGARGEAAGAGGVGWGLEGSPPVAVGRGAAEGQGAAEGPTRAPAVQPAPQGENSDGAGRSGPATGFAPPA
ncbi:RDD family protein [Streptomyces sp. NPDC004609]|uniref:RDD family protein n=1 Tax=Streptomyces sp. NPDC004609 TaxID=3364704 RepID=UPI00367FCB65